MGRLRLQRSFAMEMLLIQGDTMNRAALARVGLGALRFRLTGKRVPLRVFLSVTNQCEAACGYCAIPFRAQREMTTRELMEVIDELAENHCQSIVLTGGEPLLRPDIGDVISRCHAHGIWTRLETNGYRFIERADELRDLDALSISLDGPTDVHDRIREPGGWCRAMDALLEAHARQIPVRTVTVLTRYNLDSLDYLLDLASDLGHQADFRLLHHRLPFDAGKSEDLQPTPPQLRRAIRCLLEARREARPVALTEKTLRSLLVWDDYGKPTSEWAVEDQQCLAGQMFCFIDADGSLYGCPQVIGEVEGKDVQGHTFSQAFERLHCDGCQACVFPELTELNYLMNLNPLTVAERVFKSSSSRKLALQGPVGSDDR